MVGVKITRRVSSRLRTRDTAATTNSKRINRNDGDCDIEARKREEILYEFLQNPHSRERARIAWIESFEKDLYLVKRNLRAAEKALRYKCKSQNGKENTM